MAKDTTIIIIDAELSPVPDVDITAGDLATRTTDAEGKVVASLADDFKKSLLLAVEYNGRVVFTKILVTAGETYTIKVG